MNLNEAMLGKVYESQEITGYVLPEVAKLMGITSKCAVVGGASDNSAGGVGTGVVAPGRAMTTIGTSEQYLLFPRNRYLILINLYIHSVCRFREHGILWEV